MFYNHRHHPLPAPEDRRVVLVLDYSEKSSSFLRNFIEAKKTLELDSLLKVEYEVINGHAVPFSTDPGGGLPRLYIDGVLVSIGRVPSVEELVALILNPRPVEKAETDIMSLEESGEPPWFGAAAFAGA